MRHPTRLHRFEHQGDLSKWGAKRLGLHVHELADGTRVECEVEVELGPGNHLILVAWACRDLSEEEAAEVLASWRLAAAAQLDVR